MSSLATVSEEDVEWVFKSGVFHDATELWNAIKSRSDQAGHLKGAHLPKVSGRVIGLFIGATFAFLGMFAFILFSLAMRSAPAALTLSFVLLIALVALGLYLRFFKRDRLFYAALSLFLASVVLFSIAPQFWFLRIIEPRSGAPLWWWPLLNLALSVVMLYFVRHHLISLLIYVYAEMTVGGVLLQFPWSENTYMATFGTFGALLLGVGWILDRKDHDDFALWPFLIGLINICSVMTVLFWISQSAALNFFLLPLALVFVVAGWLLGYIVFHFAAVWALGLFALRYTRYLSGIYLGVVFVAIGLIVLAGTVLLSRYRGSFTRWLAQVLPSWAFTPRVRRQLGYDTIGERDDGREQEGFVVVN